MGALDLARTQFALTTSIHWVFVLVTLGLLAALLYFQTRATLSRKQESRDLYFRMTRFWGMAYVINYALGIATGIVMEFQFGTHWSGLSHVAGGVFGAPLALETIIAFTAESTFLALWIFGWNRIPRVAHLVVLWVVAITAYLSAFWVLVANGWMQNPVGYEMRDGRAVLVDAGAVFANPSTWHAFGHILGAALTVGGTVVLGVSAWHLFRKRGTPFWLRSFRTGLVTAFIGLNVIQATGFPQQDFVKGIQPMKFGGDAADMVARFGPGDYTPWDGISGVMDAMQGIGNAGYAILLLALPLAFGKLAARARWAMPVLWIFVPFPILAAISGWVFREMGRQPWIVYGVEKTADAFSGVSAGGMWVSLIGFTAVLGTLLVTDWWLILRHTVRGPVKDPWVPDAAAASAPEEPVLLGGVR
ncbi:cytochrome ubiquinol oxidase subunit I [Actinorhabdospora filicis]|uniref:Cytochrome ubiquinol oxidase subunit I n=1 Tax=Actinorhabdospora filicis TaxID=1785913 RepID=A0A9W6WBR6_9ACTN|nr:cytochrome ubiquinol oxidase subunit I [Actinorhabdospora filicis]GLZ80899.1 cytochrome ubiquinol oxidase subunit I [Actinorhabdospora filicis]